MISTLATGLGVIAIVLGCYEVLVGRMPGDLVTGCGFGQTVRHYRYA